MLKINKMLHSILVGSLSLDAIASADTVVVMPSSSTEQMRAGLVLGGSLDGGNLGCRTKNGDDCGTWHEAGGLSLHVGTMVSPDLAVLGEIWGMGHTEDHITVSQGLLTGALRGWVAPRLWFQGGLGIARSKVSYSSGDLMASEQSDTVPAFMVGAGVEVLSTPTFGLDVELRGGTGFYQGDARVYNAAFGVGASWY
jgi:hypothetical protein